MEAEVFGFTTHRNVKGKRKIGLDSNVIIDLAGVKQIYSQDDIFVGACEFLGIEAGRLIEKESDDLDRVRRFFKQQYKK